MKKILVFCLTLVTLFLVSIGIGVTKVSAYFYNPYKQGEDFSPYKDNIVYCDLAFPNVFLFDGNYVYLYIDELSSRFQFYKNSDFDPVITSTLPDESFWNEDGFYEFLGVTGIYWNPWGQFWQIGYPDELEFYKEQYAILKDEISSLQDEISTLKDDKAYLEEILRNWEGYLESEYSRGYNSGYDDGYDVGYGEGVLATESEAYEQGYKDGQKSKLAENNEKFYSGIEKWLVPAIIAVIVLGGFVSIAVRKRKEE